MDKAVPFPLKFLNIAHGVIEITHACNISCVGCYSPNTDIFKPLDAIFREIDFFREKRHLEILTISGGEPTLHKDIVEVIRYVASKGIKPLLLTNATLLTEETLHGRNPQVCVDVLQLLGETGRVQTRAATTGRAAARLAGDPARFESNRNISGKDGVEATIFWLSQDIQDLLANCFTKFHFIKGLH